MKASIPTTIALLASTISASPPTLDEPPPSNNSSNNSSDKPSFCGVNKDGVSISCTKDQQCCSGTTTAHCIKPEDVCCSAGFYCNPDWTCMPDGYSCDPPGAAVGLRVGRVSLVVMVIAGIIIISL